MLWFSQQSKNVSKSLLQCSFGFWVISKLQLRGWPQEVLISGTVLLLPFPLVTSSPSLASTIDTGITLPTLRVKGQSHFSALYVPFPLADSFPGVKASCHLNSHQFTRGKGVVSIGNPLTYLTRSLPFLPSPTHPSQCPFERQTSDLRAHAHKEVDTITCLKPSVSLFRCIWENLCFSAAEDQIVGGLTEPLIAPCMKIKQSLH